MLVSEPVKSRNLPWFWLSVYYVIYTAATAGTEENEEYVPPKAESVEHTEEGAFYTVRYKIVFWL